MADSLRVLAFAGSARRDSLNRKLLAIAVERTRAAGAEVTLLDLNDFPLPLYHGDLEDEQGLPAPAKKLVELINSHPALLIASPEYNSFFTPLLKNTIDWCTRAEENPFIGRVVSVISASPGVYGGIRSAQHLRHLLLHLGCLVVPTQCSIPHADAAFDEQGRLTDARATKSLERAVRDFVQAAQRAHP